MTILFAFRLILFLMLFPLVFCWRMIVPARPMSPLAALLWKEVIVGLWHWVFGARKVQVVNDERRSDRSG